MNTGNLPDYFTPPGSIREDGIFLDKVVEIDVNGIVVCNMSGITFGDVAGILKSGWWMVEWLNLSIQIGVVSSVLKI